MKIFADKLRNFVFKRLVIIKSASRCKHSPNILKISAKNYSNAAVYYLQAATATAPSPGCNAYRWQAGLGVCELANITALEDTDNTGVRSSEQ